jgi:hypothetical protein
LANRSKIVLWEVKRKREIPLGLKCIFWKKTWNRQTLELMQTIDEIIEANGDFLIEQTINKKVSAFTLAFNDLPSVVAD